MKVILLICMVVAGVVGAEWSGGMAYVVSEVHPEPGEQQRQLLLAMQTRLGERLQAVRRALDACPADRLQRLRQLRADLAVFSEEERRVQRALGGAFVVDHMSIRLERASIDPSAPLGQAQGELACSFRHHVVDHGRTQVIDRLRGELLDDPIRAVVPLALDGQTDGSHAGLPVMAFDLDGGRIRCVLGLPNPFRYVLTDGLAALPHLVSLARVPGMPLEAVFPTDQGFQLAWRWVPGEADR